MAKLFVIKGEPESGKTTTCWIIYHKLVTEQHAQEIEPCWSYSTKKPFEEDMVRNFPSFIDVKNEEQEDFHVTLQLKGKTIGLCSRGDYVNVLYDYITENQQLDYIICCPRVNGNLSVFYRVRKKLPANSFISENCVATQKIDIEGLSNADAHQKTLALAEKAADAIIGKLLADIEAATQNA